MYAYKAQRQVTSLGDFYNSIPLNVNQPPCLNTQTLPPSPMLLSLEREREGQGEITLQTGVHVLSEANQVKVDPQISTSNTGSTFTLQCQQLLPPKSIPPLVDCFVNVGANPTDVTTDATMSLPPTPPHPPTSSQKRTPVPR